MFFNQDITIMRCTRIIRDVFQRHLKWRQCLLLVFTGLVSFTANATIVATSVRATHLIQDYLQAEHLSEKIIVHKQAKVIKSLDNLTQISSRQIASVINNSQPKHENISWIYPVCSQHLKPGHVNSRRIQIALPQPIFIVGDDQLSKAWLRHFAGRLVHIHAKGFVVNVASQEAMQNLKNNFPQLLFVPMPGDALATWLKLTHYPVLISDTRIEQ